MAEIKAAAAAEEALRKQVSPWAACRLLKTGSLFVVAGFKRF
jgi:hypothetical protein